MERNGSEQVSQTDSNESESALARPAALQLGLCSLRNILTPTELTELYEDVNTLARQRRVIPEGWSTDLIG